MMKTYSIAKARAQLSKIICIVEKEGGVQLMHSGKVVAFMLSPNEYARLQGKPIGFWEAYCEFRQRLEQQALDLEPDKVFADVRDQAPGSGSNW